jgi:hypothetical protein
MNSADTTFIAQPFEVESFINGAFLSRFFFLRYKYVNLPGKEEYDALITSARRGLRVVLPIGTRWGRIAIRLGGCAS